MAGKRKGTEDSRHLWPEMLRAIRECRPTWIVGENVPGLINWSGGLVFEQVCAELEGEGYEVQPIVLPACGVNAPHRRDRVWFVANAVNGGYSAGRSKTTKENRIQGISREAMESGEFDRASFSRPTQNPNEDGRGGDEQVIPDTESTGSTRRTERTESEHAINGGAGENGNAANPQAIGMERGGAVRQQVGKTHGGQRLSVCDRAKTDWTDWPTVAPIRDVNDGVSRIMVRNIKPEIYATIKDRYTDKDLQEVWSCFQSEDIREQIGGLYKIHDPSLLLQTLQLCSTSYKYEGGFSDFSEETSKDLLRKLSDHKTFANTPRGRELEKQFSEQFKDTLPKLSHEIALVTMEVERASKKFASWHRNESIKAGGNAIVPQVAFQIFKTIERYQSLNQ